MPTPSPLMRDLARRLLVDSEGDFDPQRDGADAAIEKLRVVLTTFAGPEGFASLLRRALTLAAKEETSLRNVKIGADGRLEGLGALTTVTHHGQPCTCSDAAVEVTAQLLTLLETFVGQALTLTLVREAWPDLALEDCNPGNRGSR